MELFLKISIIVALFAFAFVSVLSKKKIWTKIWSVVSSVVGIAVTLFFPSVQNNITYNNYGTVYYVFQSEKAEFVAPKDNDRTLITLQNRNLDKEMENDRWYGTVVANEGDTIRFKVTYTNKSESLQNDVLVFVKWSGYLEYIPGSTMLYNSNHKEGIKLDSDGLADDTGINIGNYEAGASAVVTYEARVKSCLGIGTNVLRNLTQIYVNDLTPELGKDFVQDYADVMVLKEK